MSNELSDVPAANPPSDPSRTHPILRVGVLVGIFIVSLPFLMMMGMGLMGQPMQSGMAGPVQGILPVVGFLLFIVLIGVLYGAFRVTATEKSESSSS